MDVSEITATILGAIVPSTPVAVAVVTLMVAIRVYAYLRESIGGGGEYSSGINIDAHSDFGDRDVGSDAYSWGRDPMDR